MRTLIVIILLLPGVLEAQQVRNEIRKGNNEYKDGNYNEAELHYRRALEKNPESSPANFNLGNTLYKQDQYEAATSKYELMTNNTSADKTDMAKYYYNLGNSYFQSKKLQQSIEAYKQSLRLNPNDADAKHNLFLAQQLMKKQQQEQQQNQKNQDKNQQQQEQQQQQQQQQQQKQPQQKQQISQQDAERLLEALEQDEKETLKKVEEQKMNVRKVRVEKEW